MYLEEHEPLSYTAYLDFNSPSSFQNRTYVAWILMRQIQLSDIWIITVFQSYVLSSD